MPDSRIVAALGRSVYSHAAMAAWWYDTLMLAEMKQWLGGHAVTLSSQVEAAPGRWDVFTSAMPWAFDGAAAAETMIRLTGTRYGWWNVARVAVLHLPLLWWLARPLLRDDANGSAPYCSEAVSRACRAGGIDPVPNLADRLTEPSDLARSAFFRYRFTLV